MLQLVEEKVSGCVTASCEKERWYVIDTPINETGVCKQFASKKDAEMFMNQLKVR